MVASAILAWPLTRILRVPLITCVQNSFSKHATLMRLGDRVITGCNAVAKTMVERGIPWKKLRPILNGTLGSARLPTRDAPEMTLQRPAVVTVCGLHPRKGVPDLITAFESVRARDPRLHLYIVGEGPYEAAYKRLVSDDNRANVHFVGPLHDPRPYLKGADLFVLASLADPAPLVLPEAREAGLAVIATNVDGIPELLENGAAGILVRPSAPDELAARMAELFADTAKLQHWRVNSQINLAYLSVRRVAEQTVEVYRECIA
jgi:glycosyltransferase involved in cell wall biosynthesis